MCLHGWPRWWAWTFASLVAQIGIGILEAAWAIGYHATLGVAELRSQSPHPVPVVGRLLTAHVPTSILWPDLERVAFVLVTNRISAYRCKRDGVCASVVFVQGCLQGGQVVVDSCLPAILERRWELLYRTNSWQSLDSGTVGQLLVSESEAWATTRAVMRNCKAERARWDSAAIRTDRSVPRRTERRLAGRASHASTGSRTVRQAVDPIASSDP